MIRYAKIGGAFGGREDMSVQALVALATWMLKRPAAIRWSREESIIGHHKRHPFFIPRSGARSATARSSRSQTTLIADGGAYASTSVEVLKGAMTFAHGPYDDRKRQHRRLRLSTRTTCRAARSAASARPQAHFAAESMMTRVAHALRHRSARRAAQEHLPRRQHQLDADTLLPAGRRARCRSSNAASKKRALRLARRRSEPRRSSTQTRAASAFASGIKNVGYSFGFPEQATATVELVVRDGDARGAGAHRRRRRRPGRAL